MKFVPFEHQPYLIEETEGRATPLAGFQDYQRNGRTAGTQLLALGKGFQLRQVQNKADTLLEFLVTYLYAEKRPPAEIVLVADAAQPPFNLQRCRSSVFPFLRGYVFGNRPCFPYLFYQFVLHHLRRHPLHGYGKVGYGQFDTFKPCKFGNAFTGYRVIFGP